MTFAETLSQVLALLQQEGRVSYRGLKRRLALEDEDLEALKAELIKAKRLSVDEDGEVLVWAGEGRRRDTEPERKGEAEPRGATPPPDSLRESVSTARGAEGERRQLTVMFIDLVGSTALS